MSLGGWRAPSNAGSDGPKVLGPLPSARAQDRLRYSDPEPSNGTPWDIQFYNRRAGRAGRAGRADIR